MFKNKLGQITISLALAAVLLFSVVTFVSADGQTCVTQYGQATNCGTTPEEYHAPVQAGLGDINIGVVGGILLITSGILFVYTKRNKFAH